MAERQPVQVRPSDILIRALLDELASVEQQKEPYKFAWGQHVATETGDTLAQWGLHGTSQAAIALAQGVQYFARPNRYERHLEGAKQQLLQLASQPKKPLDQRKTLKVAVLAVALGFIGDESGIVKPLLEQLAAGKAPECAAWSFDLHCPGQSLHPLPTLYAAIAFISNPIAASAIGEEEIADKALSWAISNVDGLDEVRQSAIVYLAAYIVAKFGNDHVERATRNRVCDRVRRDCPIPSPVAEQVRFEYSIPKNGDHDHAFCNVLTGLLATYVQEWFRSLEEPLPEAWQAARFLELRNLHDSQQLQLIERYSLMVDILIRFGPQLEDAAGSEALDGSAAALPANATGPDAPAVPAEPDRLDPAKLRFGELLSAMTTRQLCIVGGSVLTILGGTGGAGYQIANFQGKLERGALEDARYRSTEYREVVLTLEAVLDYERALAAGAPELIEATRVELGKRIQAESDRYSESGKDAERPKGLTYIKGDDGHPSSIEFGVDRRTLGLPHRALSPGTQPQD